MLRDSLRLATALACWSPRQWPIRLLTRATPLPPAAPRLPVSAPLPGDVEGWYQITPQERAVTCRLT